MQILSWLRNVPLLQGRGALFCIVIKLQPPQTSWLPGRGLTIANWTPNGQSYQLGVRGRGGVPHPFGESPGISIPLAGCLCLHRLFWFLSFLPLWPGIPGWEIVFSSVSPTHFTATEKGHVSFSGDVFLKYPSGGKRKENTSFLKCHHQAEKGKVINALSLFPLWKCLPAPGPGVGAGRLYQP